MTMVDRSGAYRCVVHGWPESFTWMPFIFLAIVVLGFCTWEGGLWGIQEPNHQFKRFQRELDDGKHILFVDIEQSQQQTVQSVLRDHPGLQSMGKGTSMPRVVVLGQQCFNRFMRWAP